MLQFKQKNSRIYFPLHWRKEDKKFRILVLEIPLYEKCGRKISLSIRPKSIGFKRQFREWWFCFLYIELHYRY